MTQGDIVLQQEVQFYKKVNRLYGDRIHHKTRPQLSSLWRLYNSSIIVSSCVIQGRKS